MKRPAFQFYPGSWRNNAKLRRCSWAARGVWVEVLALMHDEDEYGVLRWPLAEIATALGCPKTLLLELAHKDVLKGAERGRIAAYSYTPRHAGKAGAPVVLLAECAGPAWYSSRLVRDEYLRSVRGVSTRFDGGSNGAPIPPMGAAPKATPKATPIPPIGAPPIPPIGGGLGGGIGGGSGDGALSLESKVKNNGVEVTTVSRVDAPEGNGNGQSNPLTPIFETKQGEKQGKTFAAPAKMLTMPSGWRTDDRATDQAGRLLGLTPGTFESYSEFRRRIAVTYEAHRLAFFGLRQTPENDRSSGDENRAE